MSKTKQHKTKQSVNPAKNAAAKEKTGTRAKSTEPHNADSSTIAQQNDTTQQTSRTNEEKVNDLDKNRLKNWKLRRELKKALNSDLDSRPQKKKENNSSTVSSSNAVKSSRQDNDQNKNSKEETLVETIDESEQEFSEPSNDPEQEYAPEKIEQFKQNVHSRIGKTVRKLSPFPALKALLYFWLRQLKKLSVQQTVFLIVSLLIIVAFVVPPIWSAIDLYRSGMWSLFG